MTLERIAPGSAVLSMPVSEAMLNGRGTCHGGFIFTLADSALAFACNSRNARAVAAHCSITFLRPSQYGDRLIATAEERATAGRSGVYDVRVTTQDGTVVAEFRGHSRLTGGTLIED
jgi:acyl-CoA thioesterase